MVSSEVIGAAIFIKGVRIQKHKVANGKAHQFSTKNSVVAKAIKAKTAIDWVSVIPFLNPNIICLSNAAPRVLNETAMETFMDLVLAGRIKFLRQWTKGDWVPTVPQQNLGYFHQS